MILLKGIADKIQFPSFPLISMREVQYDVYSALRSIL
jgi:hypothetical protein